MNKKITAEQMSLYGSGALDPQTGTSSVSSTSLHELADETHSCPECGYIHRRQPSNEELAAACQEALAEFKREFGPIPEEIQAEVRRKWETLSEKHSRTATD